MKYWRVATRSSATCSCVSAAMSARNALTSAAYELNCTRAAKSRSSSCSSASAFDAHPPMTHIAAIAVMHARIPPPTILYAMTLRRAQTDHDRLAYGAPSRQRTAQCTQHQSVTDTAYQ